MELREDNSSNYAGNLSFSLSIPWSIAMTTLQTLKLKDSGTNDRIILVSVVHIYV